MARVFAKALIGLAAALVPTGIAAAQDDFAEGVKLWRLGRLQEALQIFEQVVASNPSNEEAMKWFRDTDQAVFRAMLAEKGELAKIAKHILDLATVARKVRSRDTAKIDELVEMATSGDFGQRSKANLELMANHGEFAVPALARKLGNRDDDQGQVYAILALEQIGRDATLALIETLRSDNEILRRNAIAALNAIRDRRAAPAIAAAAATDPAAIVKETAQKTLVSWEMNASAAALDLYLNAANRYIAGTGIRPGEHSDVVWSWRDGELVAADVPGIVYELELAKKLAHDAVELAPNSRPAKVALAQAYLGQAAAIEAAMGQESAASLENQVPALRMTAAATGLPVVRRAAADAVRDGLTATAVAAMELLGEIEDRKDLASSPLVAALDNADARIAYAAALALNKAGAGLKIPAADKVVDVLANAVTEETILNIKVVDASPMTQKAVAAANFKRGINVDQAMDATVALNDVLQFRNVDVVIINEVLPNQRPEGTIGVIRKNLPNTKILVLAKDTDAAAERFGDKVDGVIQGPLSSADTLQQAVATALEGVEAGPRRARADKVAVAASAALSTMARNGSNVTEALTNLSAQLSRADSVAVPAAEAIGYGGTIGQVPALVGAITGDAASADLKVACAEAAGRIFGRTGELSSDVVNQLMTVVSSDADMRLRTAVVQALGKAKLDAATKVKLINALRVMPSAGAEG